MILDERKNSVHLETIILRHRQVLHATSFNDYKLKSQLNKISLLLTLFGTIHQVFEEVDGDSIVGW